MTCAVRNCGRKVLCRGYCCAHYQRWTKYGHAEGGGPMKTQNGTLLRWMRRHLNHEGEGCLPWPFAVNHRGYGAVYFRGRTRIASRVMCILAHGEPPSEDHQAAHSCGKGHEGCVHPGHLSWATQTENMADQLEHGTRARGVTHGMRKLSPEQVRAIRSQAGKQRHKDIAAKFGINRRTVGHILSGERWRHL